MKNSNFRSPFTSKRVPFGSPFCQKLGPLWVPFLQFLGPLEIWAQCKPSEGGIEIEVGAVENSGDPGHPVEGLRQTYWHQTPAHSTKYTQTCFRDMLKIKINSQSLEDTQVGYISRKYTLDNYNLENTLWWSGAGGKWCEAGGNYQVQRGEAELDLGTWTWGT